MLRRWWKWLVGLGIVLLLVVGFDRCMLIYWLGRTDLEVAFVITDAEPGEVIPGARIEVRSEGGFYEERQRQRFVLQADEDGIARKVCRRNKCSGALSGLGFTDTFGVSLPWWTFRVSAPGHETSPWLGFDDLGLRGKAHRTGPGKSRLTVPVSLRGLEQ